MDESDLYGAGVPRGDFVLKAHLRVQTHLSPLPVVQGCIDELLKAHDSCALEVSNVLSGLSRDNYPDIGVITFSPIAKAVPNLPGAGQFRIKHPGSRGGKYWRDKKGNIRYGEQPGPGENRGKQVKGDGKAKAAKEEVDETSHFRPTQLGFDRHLHKEVSDHLSRSKDHQFSDGELNFMDWWHGDGARGFVEQYGGVDLDDLGHGVDGLHFQREDGAGSMEDAVQDFFASQDWGGANYESEVAPLLADMFSRYHKATQDEKVVESVDKKESAYARRWFAKADKVRPKLRNLASDMSSSRDASLTAESVIAALLLMDLITSLEKQGVKVSAPNNRLLAEGARRLGSVLHSKFGKSFSSLASVQLMLAFVGASLNAIWDDDRSVYYDGGGVPQTALGIAAMGALADKSGLSSNISVLKDHLSEVTLSIARSLNRGAE